MRVSQRNRIGVQGGYVMVSEAREAEGRPWEKSDEIYLRSPGLIAVDGKTGEPVVMDSDDIGIGMENTGKDADGDGLVFEQDSEGGDVDMGPSARATLARLDKLMREDGARELLKGTSEIIDDAWPSSNGNGAHAEVLEAGGVDWEFSDLESTDSIDQPLQAPVLIRADPALPPNVQKVNDMFNELVTRASTKYGEELEQFFEHVGKEIYEGSGDSFSKWVTLAVETDNDLASIAGEVNEKFTQIQVNGIRDADMTTIFENLSDEMISGVVDSVNSSLGVGVNLPDHRQRQVIADGGRRVGLIDLNRQSKDALFNALHKARSDGLGVDAAARLLRQHIEAGPFPDAGVNYRAKLIARTEAKHAQRVSALELYDEAGWTVVALDAQLGPEVSDPDCIARNGREFSVAEAKIETQAASVHPNCTLAWMPKVSE